MKVAPLFIREVGGCESWWNSWIESKNNCRRQLATFFPIFIRKHSIFVAIEDKKKPRIYTFFFWNQSCQMKYNFYYLNTTWTLLNTIFNIWIFLFLFLFYLFIFYWSAFKAFFFIYFMHIFFFTNRQMYKYIVVQKILEIFYLDCPLYRMN